MRRSDIAIIGGGIVGLACAYQVIRRFPKRSVVVLEKEHAVGMHQSGRNSGVLHSGIYYKPGSLKALICCTGKSAMEQFCTEEGVPWKQIGKIIVAVNESELPTLQMIYERGVANGVRCELKDGGFIREREPHVQGIKAIFVPEAGIVNYAEVCRALARKITSLGGEIKTSTKLVSAQNASNAVTLVTSSEEIEAGLIVNCAGLYSDTVSQILGMKPAARIIPFRGEYYALSDEAQHLCKALIYPVPNVDFPFLGVHFTRMIDGSVECGPNAVFAFAREGYRFSTVHPGELYGSLSYPGFLRFAAKHWRDGVKEMYRSLCKAAFLRSLQRLIPEVQSHHLRPAAAGVRAQALKRDGSLVDDFLVTESSRVINILNAPSPAATSSLSIGLKISHLVPPPVF